MIFPPLDWTSSTKVQFWVLLGFSSWIWLTVSVAYAVDYDLKTQLSFVGQFYPEPGEGEQEDPVAMVQWKPDLALYFTDSLQAVVAPRFRLGLTDSEYSLISPDDLYVEYVAELLEVRIGYQIYFWGAVESSNIVDVLNQKDFVEDFLDAKKLGEPSARVRTLLGENRIDLYFFAYFTPAPLPGIVNRFNFFDGTRDFSDDPFYTNAKEEWRPQAAIRWDRSLGPSDVGLAYFNGYEKFPVLNVAPDEEEADTLYYEMQQIMADLQMSLGEWLIKAEVVYQDTGIAGSFIQDTILRDGSIVLQRNLVPEDHTAFVGGVEYSFFGVVAKMDLGLIAEYMFDSEQDLRSVGFRPFQNDLFVGVRVLRNNHGDGEVLGGLIHDLKNQTQIWRVEYEERYMDRVKLRLIMDRINAAAEDPVSVFNNNDRFSIEVSYTF